MRDMNEKHKCGNAKRALTSADLQGKVQGERQWAVPDIGCLQRTNQHTSDRGTREYGRERILHSKKIDQLPRLTAMSWHLSLL